MNVTKNILLLLNREIRQLKDNRFNQLTLAAFWRQFFVI